jgi:hypothetical protein
MAIWRTHIACWIRMVTNIHSHNLCSTHHFSNATMVARTRLDVELNVHCRSCKILLSASHFEQSRFCTEMNAVNSIITKFTRFPENLLYIRQPANYVLVFQAMPFKILLRIILSIWSYILRIYNFNSQPVVLFQ